MSLTLSVEGPPARGVCRWILVYLSADAEARVRLAGSRAGWRCMLQWGLGGKAGLRTGTAVPPWEELCPEHQALLETQGELGSVGLGGGSQWAEKPGPADQGPEQAE